MSRHTKSVTAIKRLLLATSMLFVTITAQAQLDPALDWPDFYDPKAIRELHFKIQHSDWNTIRGDTTFDIEVPVLFWTAHEGEDDAVLVSIRRKSATSINGKVSFKIDINEYDDFPQDGGVKIWHELKKLSLENGDDQDVVREALAWYLHRLAMVAVYPGGHTPGLANWVTLTAHVVANQGEFEFDGAETVEPQGVYVSVEQPDKRYLKNRDIWDGDQTWLYKQDDIGLPERKEVGCEDDDEEGDSPTVHILQCTPFQLASGKGRNRVRPPDCTFDEMNDNIDMNIMLAQGAVEAFSSNRDGMFTNVKNFYWSDRSNATCDQPLGVTLRSHFPWDLDAAIAADNANVYGKPGRKRGQTVLKQTEVQRVILDEEVFRSLYNDLLGEIVGTDYIDAATQYLDDMEPVLEPFLNADPNSKMEDSVAEHFDTIRAWLLSRAANVADQICSDGGPC